MASDAELDALEASVLADASAGIDTVSVDGQTVSMMDLEKRLAIIDRLRASATPTNSFGLRTVKLISPGTG